VVTSLKTGNSGSPRPQSECGGRIQYELASETLCDRLYGRPICSDLLGRCSERLSQQGGALKEAVTFKTGAISFLAPPGEEWMIEPSGKWTDKINGVEGQFTPKQMAALAQHLATQDFNSLPKAQGYESKGPDGASRGDYKFVVIGFGKKKAVFNTKLRESRAGSRFTALELALAEMFKSAAANEEAK
jgi:hypothetical protein